MSKLVLTQPQKLVLTVLLIISIYGIIFSLMLWGLGIFDFSLQHIIGLGILYYFIDAILINWFIELKKGVKREDSQ